MKKQQKKQLKQVQNQAQEGRSMVEMLGVLAIIGVLSIGGIAGYRWGMDKHVSNQILYEMNLNSAQLAMLLQKGNPDGVTLSLGSPYDDGKFRTVDYGFAYACGEEANSGHECEYLDETMYSMTATGLPKRVCNMLSDAASGLAYASELDINDGTDECDDSNNTVTVFFDTDTTIEGGIPRPEESETHTPAPEVTEPTTTTATTLAPTTAPTTLAPISTTPLVPTTIDPNCGPNGIWNEQWGYCECKHGWYGEDCSKCSGHADGWGYCGCVCDADWIGEDCEEPKDKQCNNNNDCTQYGDYYCYFFYPGNDKQEGVQGYCDRNYGTSINGFLVKQEMMNLWSAQNFCASHGRDMATLSDLQCSFESENAIKNSGYGACYQTRTSGAVSEPAQKLQGIEYSMWLSDNLSDDAYFISDGYVSRHGYSNIAFALCK